MKIKKYFYYTLFFLDEWKMVFSHNTTGGLFSSTSALSKNEDNPTANLYSILGQLKNVTSPDGYHLKLCYPELKGKSLGAGIKSYTQENKLRHLFSYVKLFGGGLKK